MACEQAALIITQVHAVTTTVAPHLAFATFILLHPLAIAIKSEPMFPNVHEVILIDVSLHIV